MRNGNKTARLQVIQGIRTSQDNNTSENASQPVAHEVPADYYDFISDLRKHEAQEACSKKKNNDLLTWFCGPLSHKKDQRFVNMGS